MNFLVETTPYQAGPHVLSTALAPDSTQLSWVLSW